VSFLEILFGVIANSIVTGAIVLVTFRVKIEARLTRVETYLKIIADKLRIPI